jgi:hypothetical protein
MGKKDPRIDAYIAKSAPFARPILKHLRRLVHTGCPDVEETLKWSMPSFQYKGILCGMAAFKQHCTFGFWRGALLADQAAGAFESREEAMGQFGRITALSDLPSDRVLIGLVKKAVALHDRGAKVAAKPRPAGNRELKVPAWFMTALRGNPRALATFKGFTYSHRKEYVEWVTEAKTEATRERRLETTVEWLSEGKPRHWKYARR